MKKYKDIPSDLFKLNRTRFKELIEPNSIAIFHSADQYIRNGDCFFPFRQNSDLFYLSGLDQEDVVLVLYPNCPKGKDFEEIIFTKQTNDYIKVWEGYKYSKEDASKVSGISTVMWLDSMPALLNELILLADQVYLNSNENDRASGEVPVKDERMANELREKYSSHQILRSAPLMKKLRMIKSNFEIDILQKACDITESAYRRVLNNIKPGMFEYEVEADIVYEFIRNSANGHAYSPIIAGGPNACILHYNDNNKALNSGDLVLMDFGAEYANYAADTTRTIPVNGKFTDRQKDVYNATLRVKKAAEAMLVPGNNLTDYNKEVGKIMESELIGLGLITKHDVEKQNPEWPAYKKYFMHGTSHHLGLDVHDLCERYTDFKPGMVFTCEPGIYIPEEGIGIRLEDDILITDGGIINLMCNLPIEIEEIEEIMNR
jgi:Xaa-Pro aminopeptidase